MRLFVAVYPPPSVVADVTARVARLRVGAATAAGLDIRLAQPAHLHVTLAFLGEVAPGRLPGVQGALAAAAGTARAGWDGPPRLRLGGGGCFGQGRSTVLWVDVLGEVSALRTLARLIRAELDRAGLPYDGKPFRPHLTVARPGDRLTPSEVEADRLALDAHLGPPWPATDLVLVHSRPGPHHTHLTSWPL
ncbi:RNA 2',3'-cyclic phosphodiesterase [Micromonospora humidisoli]|uniref:RNA 2',3'-cyclic phosphodiesterase n=1 Tax=Micromonospora humidisoli TaxID=2807622 RepID=A0ABS2JE03_9ACTN|nr:RNA 2',3'-cyclic phosphodiesterase [Micromonospora humidisoli]MBM7083684.1 RNA 2',3'-cyclic phosphodiesterase [Micromonospora humidisoli]